MKPLEDFITPTQEQLFSELSALYRGRTSVCKNSYVLVQGEAPIMLVAHLDTVHKEPVRDICKTKNGKILMSPQGIGGDDRCGVYASVTAYEQSPVKPWLLFTCDEETGGYGAGVFCRKHQRGKLPKSVDELKMIVEIDRNGKNDAVYYNCGNDDFEKYISGKGFKTKRGSFSDISYVAPELGVAAVNLSSGYYNAHTLHEYINRKQLNNTVKKVVEIVADAAKPDTPRYEYVEAVRFSRFDDWDYGDYGGYGKGMKEIKTESGLILIEDDDPDLKNVPAEIRNEYEELLDFYSVKELEGLRKEHGDDIIPMLFEFETEYGMRYDRYIEEVWG